MTIRIPNASSDSSNNKPMATRTFQWLHERPQDKLFRRPGSAPILELAHPKPRAKRVLGLALGTALALLAGCADTPSTDAGAGAATPSGATIDKRNARWVPVGWDALPGWASDAVGRAWPALQRGCARPAPGWSRACASAQALGPQATDEQARQWLQTHLRPYRVESLDGQALGRMTGYYEPQLRASRTRQGAYTVPLYRPPADLALRKPWYTRAEMSSDPQARAALAGREIAWLSDPLDAVFLQVQGSGRLEWVDAQGRSEGLVRVGFAGHNDQPFRPLSAWLVNEGAFKLEQANADAIRAWAAANPSRVTELANANPRVVFFKEQPLPDPSVGPMGSQGVPLTPGRSIAVDRDAIPMGTPVWVDTTEPQKWQPTPPPPRPLQRLMLAQDTGSAIKGAVRADYFWGWGEGADELAGRMKQPLRLWVLWPREP